MSTKKSSALGEDCLEMPRSHQIFWHHTPTQPSNFRATSFKKANRPFDLRGTPSEWVDVQNILQFKTTDPKELRKLRRARKARNKKEEVLGPIIKYQRLRYQDSPVPTVRVDAPGERSTGRLATDVTRMKILELNATEDEDNRTIAQSGNTAEAKVDSQVPLHQSSHAKRAFKHQGYWSAYLKTKDPKHRMVAALDNAFEAAALGNGLKESWSMSNKDDDFWFGRRNPTMDSFSGAFFNRFSNISSPEYVAGLGVLSPPGSGTLSPETTIPFPTPTKKPSKKIVKPRNSFQIKRKYEEDEDTIAVEDREDRCSCNTCAGCISRSAPKSKSHARPLPRVYSPILPKPDEGKTREYVISTHTYAGSD